jgi:hypothetical protein
MLYTLVLNNGNELRCHTTQSLTKILGHYLQDEIYIVQENNRPEHNSYIERDKVSHIVFDHKDDKTEAI